MRLWRAPGDGSCFFHSVGHHTGASATELRTVCADLVTKRAEEMLDGMSLKDWIGHETGLSVEAYANAIRRSHWGGYVEMKLLSDYFCRPVVLYGNYYGTKATRLEVIEPNCSPCGPRGPIVLLHNGRVHYDALDFE